MCSGKDGSCTMTAPTLEFVKECLLRADSMLSDARLMMDNGRWESAADWAYYAMYHAAEAAVSQAGAEHPRTHDGMHTMFARLFTATGRLPREMARELSRT